MKRLCFLSTLLCCMSLFVYSSDGEIEFKRCIEPKTIRTVAQNGQQRFYGTAHAIALLEGWERMVFQVAVVSSPDAELANALTNKIRTLFYAMHKPEEATRLGDEQYVLQQAIPRGLSAEDPRIFAIEYKHKQFFFNMDHKKFEQSVPALLVPEILQSAYAALPGSLSGDKAFNALKEAVEKDFPADAVTSEVPVMVIDEQMCAEAYGMYQSFMRGD